MQLQQHALGRHGGTEGEWGIGPEGAHGVADGKIHADAVHKRRLAHGLVAVRPGGLVRILQKRHLNVVRHEKRIRHLVGGQRRRETLAALVELQVFHGHPAESLRQTALHLPEIHRPVQRPAEIMHDLHRIHRIRAAQAIHRDLDDGRAIYMIRKRPALFLFAIEIQIRRGVITVRRQIHAAEIRLLHQLAPGHAGVVTAVLHRLVGNLDALPVGHIQLLRRHAFQPVENLPDGDQRGVAVQHRSGAGRAGRHVGHPRGVGGLDADTLRPDAQRQRGNACEIGAQPLAHFYAAGGDADAAVGVHMHQRTGLIQKCGCERNAETHRHERIALFDFEMRVIECLHALADGRQVVGRHSLIPGAAGAAPFRALAVRERIALLQQILALNLFPRQVQRLGHSGDGAFDHEHGLRTAEAAKCGERRQIGAARHTEGAHVGDKIGVGAVEQRPLENRRGQIRRGAGVLKMPHLISKNGAVAFDADFEFRHIGMALAGHAHVLGSAEHQLHRPAGVPRGQRRHARPRRGLIFLAAETTAEPQHIHLDGVIRHAENARRGALRGVRALRG